MIVTVTNQGEIALLDMLLTGNTANMPARLKLYRNNHTPTEYDLAATYDPATFIGSDPVELDPALWSPAVNEMGVAHSVYGASALQFENTGAVAETVYGYYVLNAAGNIALWAERFDEPMPMVPGATLQVWPVFTAKSQY